MLLPLAGGRGTVVKFGEFVMILELHRQGLKVAAIARQLGIDRKTVRKYISRGLEPPTYGPRPRRQKSTDPFLPYLRERLAAYPSLTAVRLWRELRDRGYAGGYGFWPGTAGRRGAGSRNADSDEVAQAFRNDVARRYEMKPPSVPT